MARVLQVLTLIQSRGRWDLQSIADELKCSQRTVRRDLEVLQFAGIPWYMEQGRAIRVRPDYRFPLLMLTDEEVLGQALATVLTQTPGLDVNQGAGPTTHKLSSESNQHVQELLTDAMRLTQVFDLKLADHSQHRQTIKTIQWGLLQRKQLIGTYASPYEPKPLKLTLHPFRLCLIKQAWYLVGQATSHAEVRTFRVARFKSLRLHDSSSKVPDKFSLTEYFGNAWGVYRGETSYDLKLRFTPEASRIVTETVWHHTQTTVWNRDGSVSLGFRVDGLDEIVHWVLSWGERVKVDQPTELRELVLNKLNAAIQRQLAE